MKLAIDSYCYHRQFGECYAGLEMPATQRLDVFGFIEKARALGVAGVSLEACFLPLGDDKTAAGFIDQIKVALDGEDGDAPLERIWAWGHLHGLHSGGVDSASRATARAAAADLARHLTLAQQVGAGVMRICAGSRATRPPPHVPWAQHKAALLALLRPLLDVAEKTGVVIAIENHIDLLADELLDLVQTLDTPWLGVCFDTANNLRLFEHPLAVAQKLAPWIRATHIKDIAAQRTHSGDPKTFAFWPSVPVGRGLVEIPAILQVLQAADYRGLLAVEIDYLHPQHRNETGADKDCYEDCYEDSALRQSLDYLREQLTNMKHPGELDLV